MIYAESVKCALHERVFSLPVNQESRSWRGILISAGSGAIRSADSELTFSATTLVWGPWSSDMALWINAGSVGVHFSVSAASLSNAIGHNVESSEIRLLADRLSTAKFEPTNPVIGDSRHAFDVILREVGNRRHGSESMIEAQVRAILVMLWRNSAGQETVGRSIGRTQAILSHFRQLVETHFRDHWPVGKYADELRISADRLHDICSRNLGKTPSQLLHDRTIHEARMMLENTSLSVVQLSATLGFRDVTYFSRFFRARVGLPPATYRRQAAIGSGPDDTNGEERFADWP